METPIRRSGALTLDGTTTTQTLSVERDAYATLTFPSVSSLTVKLTLSYDNGTTFVNVPLADNAGATYAGGATVTAATTLALYADVRNATHIKVARQAGSGTAVVASCPYSAETATLAGLAKAEDAAHTSGDLGLQVLTVRRDTAIASAGTTGDYQPLATDANGCAWVNMNTLLAGEDQTTNRLLVEQRFNLGRVTADGLVKSGAGFIHTVTFSATGAVTAGVVTVYDNTAESGTVLWSGVVQTGLNPTTITLDGVVGTGIYVGYDGTIANVAVTVSYR